MKNAIIWIFATLIMIIVMVAIPNFLTGVAAYGGMIFASWVYGAISFNLGLTAAIYSDSEQK